MVEGESGYSEIEHTADWALKVWGPNVSALFTRAAEGMYWLMETTLEDAPRVERRLDLESIDLESLLVMFLGELLYLGESEGLGFDSFAVAVEDGRLSAELGGARIAEQKKEIKAVTYHNLRVEQSPAGWKTTIVFDV